MRNLNLVTSISIALFILSCNNNKTYYITIMQEDGVNKFDSVISPNDSAAYWEGVFSYTANIQVYNAYKDKTLGEYISKPIGFKVVDKAGNDIESRLNHSVTEATNKYITSKTKDLTTQTANVSNTNVSNKETKPSNYDSNKIKNLSSFVTFKKDEFKGITWVEPKTKPQYRNQNGIYCYFSKEGADVSNFRLVIQYYADNWLFIKNYQFLIDGKPFSLFPAKVDTDNGDGYIWEWSDESVSLSDLPLITALCNSKSAKIRFEGSQYYKVKTISPSQIQSIKRTYALYNSMGGQF